MRLSKILEGVQGKIVYQNEDWEREIDRIHIDSKIKGKSALFICLSGGKRDSHEYAEEAVQNGAIAIVCEHTLPLDIPQIIVKDTREALGLIASVFYGNPTEKVKIIGITGTNGKTTTSYLLRSILEENGKKTGVIGTLGILYGGKRYPNELTTPDPILLHETLAQMVQEGVEYVVMEVSAHALYYKKTAGVRFSACIFTNLTQDHLDFFEDMSAYGDSKMQLFAPEVCPFAIVNGDDEFGRKIGKMRKSRGAGTSFYALNTPADAFAILLKEGLQGTECMLNINDKLCRVELSLTGEYNVYNALAAATCAVGLGVDLSSIARGLAKVHSVEGRLQRVAAYDGKEIFVDFAHTPDGIEKSLKALKKYCRGRILCLFGCGGNRDKSKRPIMGEIVGKISDFSVLTADNPRYEDPLDIICDIERGYRRVSLCYVVVPDRERAIEYAIERMREGDILLIAGKGGENYQEIMGIKYPFNDQDIVKKVLSKKGIKS